ncbi:concanavalin A-like lectin/glucanase domain-containing protein [Hyaloraphidium curvatum]|nr:concanavalin A-like lectin/glucanase domain-containing protein [Hyaloraphidium curvatum]
MAPMAATLALLVALSLPAALARSLPSSRFPHYRCQNHTEHFTDPSVLVNVTTWDGNTDGRPRWISEYDPSHAEVINGSVRMYLTPDTRPVANEWGRIMGWPVAITSSMWIGQGKVCARLRTGKGGGIVTAFMMASYSQGYEVDDELDWEIVGKPEWLSDAQSNFFALGKLNYNNSQHFWGAPNLAESQNEYCFERTKDRILWILNNQTVRTLVREQHNSTDFPYRTGEHRLMKVAISLWDGGSGPQGTMDWSGGPTNWDNPRNPDYVATVDWIRVECYDSEGVDPRTVTSFLPPLSTGRSTATRSAMTTASVTSAEQSKTATTSTQTEIESPPRTTSSVRNQESENSAASKADWAAMMTLAAEGLGLALFISSCLFM